MKAVTIIDYGLGNLYSVSRAFETQNANVVITNEADKISSADYLVLPGVGAFKKGMENLEKLGLVDALRQFIQRERPFLGICLGMQLMFDQSEEFGNNIGLGLISGDVKKLPSHSKAGEALRVPHMGWSALLPGERQWNHTILHNTLPGSYTYHVHSFVGHPARSEDILAYTNYGGYDLAVVVNKSNIIGIQSHPERSGPVGLRILESFLEL